MVELLLLLTLEEVVLLLQGEEEQELLKLLQEVEMEPLLLDYLHFQDIGIPQAIHIEWCWDYRQCQQDKV